LKKASLLETSKRMEPEIKIGYGPDGRFQSSYSGGGAPTPNISSFRPAPAPPIENDTDLKSPNYSRGGVFTPVNQSQISVGNNTVSVS